MKKTIVILAVLVFTAGALAAQEYILGEGDLLKITVYDHLDLTITVRVGGDGMITFPLVGYIRAGGRTVTEVSGVISEKLENGFIVDPHVAIFIQEFRSKKAIIMGQVRSPGLHLLHGHITLLELISKAGGLTSNAGDKAIIKRKYPTLTQGNGVITIDLKDLIVNGNTEKNIAIMDGDSVFIVEAGVFFITGEVARPASYKYEEDTTIVKAITMAGGLTDRASTGRIRIIRKIKGKEQVIKRVKMDEPVMPDDVIIVPESFF